MKTYLFILATTVSLITACAYPNPGSQPSETPPKLMMRKEMKIWDNPGSFGPVPENLREAAAKACASLNRGNETFEAHGFHPKALDLAGAVFPGGSFYCLPKN